MTATAAVGVRPISKRGTACQKAGTSSVCQRAWTSSVRLIWVQVLEKMTATAAAVGSKRRRLESSHALLGDVRSEKVVETTLSDALSDYVERIDTDMVTYLTLSSSYSVSFCR